MLWAFVCAMAKWAPLAKPEGNAAEVTQGVAGEMEEEKAREQHGPKYKGTQKRPFGEDCPL